MKKYRLGSDGFAHALKQHYRDEKPLEKITVQKQKEIDFCLSCTKPKCSGKCKAIMEYKKKLENNKDIIKRCDTCEHCIFNDDLSTYYCNKHKGIVEPTDTCIEEGM